MLSKRNMNSYRFQEVQGVQGAKELSCKMVLNQFTVNYTNDQLFVLKFLKLLAAYDYDV